jgi:hypothetical protein
MRHRLPWLPAVLRDLIKRIMSVKQSTGVARMFVRLYQTVVFLQIILRLLTSEALGSVTNMLALARMVGMFVFFFGGALQWTVKTGLCYTDLKPFRLLSLYGVLVALFVSVILDTDRLLQARKKIRRGTRMMRALRESIAETEQTKLELQGALPDEFNTLLRHIRQDPHHATHELISRSLELTTVPEEDSKSTQQQQQQQRQRQRRPRLLSGTGLTAGLGVQAKETLIWRLEVLSDQLRDRLVGKADNRRQEARFVNGLVITIVKAVVDGVNALDFVLGWGFSDVLGASLTTLSAGIGMVRLLNRERAKLKEHERLKKLE